MSNETLNKAEQERLPEADNRIHRVDCDQTEYKCSGCQLALAYEAIRMLMAQKFNPDRDQEDKEEWDRAIELGRSVLPEFKEEK